MVPLVEAAHVFLGVPLQVLPLVPLVREAAEAVVEAHALLGVSLQPPRVLATKVLSLVLSLELHVTSLLVLWLVASEAVVRALHQHLLAFFGGKEHEGALEHLLREQTLPGLSFVEPSGVAQKPLVAFSPVSHSTERFRPVLSFAIAVLKLCLAATSSALVDHPNVVLLLVENHQDHSQFDC
jgi:hypothetical protein